MWPIEQLYIELGALPNVLKISSKIAFFPKIGVRYELLGEIALKPNDLSSEGCHANHAKPRIMHQVLNQYVKGEKGRGRQITKLVVEFWKKHQK
jgi:hypothetical protein